MDYVNNMKLQYPEGDKAIYKIWNNTAIKKRLLPSNNQTNTKAPGRNYNTIQQIISQFH